MILILEVSSSQGAKLGVRRYEFSERGGIIGRGNESAWVLPHAKVSGRHAVISFRNAVFYIEDTSRNGVCVNSPDNRLVSGRPYALKSGDRIFIEPYEIQVSIGGEGHEATRRPLADSDVLPPLVPFDDANPFGSDDPFGRPAGALLDSPIAPGAESMGGEELDPLRLLDPFAKSPSASVRKSAPGLEDLARGSLMEQHYQPPVPVPVSPPPRVEPSLIPQGYDPLADDSQAFSQPTPPPPPVKFSPPPPPPPPPPVEPPPIRSVDFEPPVAPPPVSSPQVFSGVVNPIPAPSPGPAPTTDEAGTFDLAAMLEGAGLAGAAVTPELARNFGEILRVVVSGVMDVLQARQQIKDEFRMGMTHFRPANNNPLKFSANVEDALHNLLVKRNAAYLAPVEAFADAFEDLRNHQIAMLAGMRVAFESMLAEFDPDRLQEQFNRQPKGGSLLRVPAQLRYWDLYREKCRDMVKDPEASFRTLFGEEFARAYEEQLRRLKTQGSSEPPKGRR